MSARIAARAARNSTPAVNLLNENPPLSLSGSSPTRTRERRRQTDGRTDGRWGSLRSLRIGRTDSSRSDGRSDGRTVGRTDRRTDGRRGSLRSLRTGRTDKRCNETNKPNETKRTNETQRNKFHRHADQAPAQTKLSRTAAPQTSDAAGPAKRVRDRFPHGRTAPLVLRNAFGNDF